MKYKRKLIRDYGINTFLYKARGEKNQSNEVTLKYKNKLIEEKELTKQKLERQGIYSKEVINKNINKNFVRNNRVWNIELLITTPICIYFILFFICEPIYFFYKITNNSWEQFIYLIVVIPILIISFFVLMLILYKTDVKFSFSLANNFFHIVVHDNIEMFVEYSTLYEEKLNIIEDFMISLENKYKEEYETIFDEILHIVNVELDSRNNVSIGSTVIAILGVFATILSAGFAIKMEWNYILITAIPTILGTFFIATLLVSQKEKNNEIEMLKRMKLILLKII